MLDIYVVISDILKKICYGFSCMESEKALNIPALFSHDKEKPLPQYKSPLPW